MAGYVEESTLVHPRGRTRLFVGDGALERARDLLVAWADGRRLFLVTTPRVRQAHGARLDFLADAATKLVLLEVEEGESAKRVAVAESLWRRMAAAGGKRDSRLVTFGGGSVGDLGGFVAGCFLRGIGYVQLPTTLLAQVDAAVGGKTAVDLPEAKNVVGLFHHPDLVVAETGWLATLPARELTAGLMEAVKMGFTLDPELFELLEEQFDAARAGERSALARVAARAVRVKAAVVEADPEEGGRRMVLNFGHTLGHALEAVAGFRGLLHGEAVGWGMRFAVRLARTRGLEPEAAQRLEALVARAGLPPPGRLDPAEILDFMDRDKKAREGGLSWVLPSGLGSVEIIENLSRREVLEELEGFVAEVVEA